MTTRDIIGLAIVSVVAVVLIIIAILLLLGKGSSLIAGYNTSDDKEKYDTSKLCRFIGKILLPISVFLPLVAIGGIYDIRWLHFIYFGMVLVIVVFAVIYANTGNRFRRQ